jgi:hypothetical protein
MNSLKLSAIFLILFLGALNLCASQPIVLKELYKPTSIHVDQDQLYITQGAEIFIYTTKDYHLIKKFGQAGQGPQEFPMNRFKNSISLRICDALIMVNSLNRVSYFSRSGDFVREINGKGNAANYQPIKDKYIAISSAMDQGGMFTVINLFDAQLNKIKEIQRVKSALSPRGTLNLFKTSLRVLTHNHRYFLLSSNDFVIDAFDSNSTKLFTIKRDYKRPIIDEAFKTQFHNRLKNNPKTRPYYEKIKNNINFPTTFPAISNISAADNLIYITTYYRQGNKFEFYIYDLNGNFIKKTSIKINMKSHLEPYPTRIFNKKLYQLVETEDEEWQLEVSPIN